MSFGMQQRGGWAAEKGGRGDDAEPAMAARGLEGAQEPLPDAAALRPAAARRVTGLGSFRLVDFAEVRMKTA